MSNVGEPPAEAVLVAVDGIGDLHPLDEFDASDEEGESDEEGGGLEAGPAPALFLTDLADVLRRAGLRVEELDGWQTRVRRKGGFRQRPVGIIIHHMASNKGTDGLADAKSVALTVDAAPQANLYLDRSGKYWVLAGGATNTNGAGGPLGPIPLGEANRRVIGIEAGNNGVGETWPSVMQDAYVAGVAALADAYGIETANIVSHFEWCQPSCPGRKVDPAGPSRFGNINQHHTWDMNMFRAEVARKRGESEPPDVPHPDPDTPSTYIVQRGDSWWRIAEKTMGNPVVNWPKIAEANGHVQLHEGMAITIPG